ncbi:MAG: hypothetical protein DMF30_03120 [Verrucomicrobia bacterium]|nr:MAG: hypothetical protein DMF30_03120 [Verrucomicrobiota bacterium]
MRVTGEGQNRRLDAGRADANADARVAWIFAGESTFPFVARCLAQPPITIVDGALKPLDQLVFDHLILNCPALLSPGAHDFSWMSRNYARKSEIRSQARSPETSS